MNTQNKIKELEDKVKKMEKENIELANHNSLLFAQLKEKIDLHNQTKKEKEELQIYFDKNKSQLQNLQFEFEKQIK